MCAEGCAGMVFHARHDDRGPVEDSVNDDERVERFAGRFNGRYAPMAITLGGSVDDDPAVWDGLAGAKKR